MTEEQLEKIKFFESSLEKETNSAKKLRLWHDYRNYFALISPQFALEIAEKGCEYAIQVGLEEYMAMLFTKSNSLTQLERYEESFTLLSKCLTFYLDCNDNEMIVKILGAISNIFIRLELVSQAIYLLSYILENYAFVNNRELILVAKANLIQIYFSEFEKNPFCIEEIDEILDAYEIKEQTSSHAFLIISLSKSLFYEQKGDYEKTIQEIKKVIHSADKIGSNCILIDSYYTLGRVYKKINKKVEMERAYSTAIFYSDQIGLKKVYINIYEDLYEYYSSKGLYKKALESLEKFNQYTINYDEIRRRVSSISKQIGFSLEFNIDKEVLTSLNQNLDFEHKIHIIINDLKGIEHTLNINDIIFAQKRIDILKIQVAIGKPIYSKMSFKDFVNKIESYNSFYKLFFETNVRNQLVNLFWLSKMDMVKKVIYLKSIDNLFEINISKRQYPLLKKRLLQYNLSIK